MYSFYFRHEYLIESYELEQWIRDNIQAASSEDYGQDFEHLLVKNYKHIVDIEK